MFIYDGNIHLHGLLVGPVETTEVTKTRIYYTEKKKKKSFSI